MSAVASQDEYESLKAQFERFCKALDKGASTDKRSVYTVIHASKEEIPLERSAWANDWWIKQEKPRIRDTVSKYFRQMKKLPESEMTGTPLIQEVLDGVANKEQEDGDESSSNSGPKGVEVGVFIIEKTT
ncbi:hypothetical protein BKA66DRAFT_577577 [Pyrenochaeta sp. MPI-SDFR-AT-0127]|nr:hypothetical protein BKA66DRAFT_577577 [Pyrenochaeta sp. MPI-SDFR-AT-0127]